MFNPFQSFEHAFLFSTLITFAYIGFLNVIDVVVWPMVDRIRARRRRRRSAMYLRLDGRAQGRDRVHRLIEGQERSE